jgi:hypothetical protein
MASASPNPYKSRIFNAVSQQYRQFLNRCDRAGRQIRLTASYATQILLYPLYVLLQGARVIGKQLKAQVNIGLPQLKDFVKTEEATADQAIEDLLKTLAATAPDIQLQGIANRLDTQELVLIAAPTQTVYPLPQSQQKNIQQHITNALKPQSWKTPQLQPAIPAMGLILPVYCVLSQAMGWVQASPIAVRMNLFGESALARVEPTTKEKLAVFVEPQFSSNLSDAPKANAPGSYIQGLIQAAIHYFLNQSTLEFNGVKAQSQPVFPANEKAGLLNSGENSVSLLPQTEDETPQLTSGIWQKMQHSSFPLFAGVGVGGFLVAATLGKYILEDQPQKTRVQSPSVQTFGGQGLTIDEKYDNSIENNQLRQFTTVGLEPAYSENTTDYLETPISSVEYVKHPLVNLLEWLDRAVFWIEESFLKLRNWIAANIK